MWKAAAVVTITFAILVAGSFGRYELQAGPSGLFRIDRMTGEVMQCGRETEGSLKITCKGQ